MPAQSSAWPAKVWIQAPRNFAAIPNVPNWNDWSVRMGGAFDMFGNGKTALKANASKYIAAAAAGYAQNFNPMTYCGSCAGSTRAWIDFDGNKSILDAAGTIQYNEVIGGTSNFGQITQRPDPDLLRGHNWEYSASVQHELMDRVSVTAGYYRRDFYNLDVIDNQNLLATDWTPFGDDNADRPQAAALRRSQSRCSRLNTTKVGVATDNLRTFSTSNSSTYNGIEASANLRRSKLLLFGGVTTDRRATIDCDGTTNVATTPRDNPNGLRFCDATPPFRTTFKMSGTYQLPYEFQMSGTFMAIPGPSVAANYTVTAAIAGRADYRNNRRHDDDSRQPHRVEHGVPALPEEA